MAEYIEREAHCKKCVKECKMYVLYHGETPVAYRYGEPWVSQQLLMEGGYDTPEEAKRAWEDGANNG